MRCPAPGAAHPDWCRGGVELPYNMSTWQSILDLVNRPWFDRLWVTQEIQLANEQAVVQCGFEMIS